MEIKQLREIINKKAFDNMNVRVMVDGHKVNELHIGVINNEEGFCNIILSFSEL